MMRNSSKSNLDEQQEFTLRGIESRACWYMYWALFISVIAQIFMYGFNDCAKYVAGEWIIFMCISLYLVIRCIKNGIWDRKLKANTSTNVMVSAASGIIAGVIFFFLKMKDYPDKIAGCIASGVIIGVMVLVLVFLALELTMKTYQKRIEALEKEPEGEE